MSWFLETRQEVDEMYARAVDLGLDISMPPTDEPWGVREFHLRHPDGHTFRVGAHSPRAAEAVRTEASLGGADAAVLAGEPAAHELGGRVVDAVLRRLTLEPRGELRHAVGELSLRRVPERLRRELQVGEAVADVADA